MTRVERKLPNRDGMIYLYTRYERFWHWFQMLIIFILLVTGFEVHGNFTLLGFKNAVYVHNWVGILWLISFAFFVFWIFATGEWKQYIPTSKKMFAVIRYYSYGMFAGEHHPYKKIARRKHNPLQRITYLILTAIFLTFQMISGLLYWAYNYWGQWNLTWLDLKVWAILHISGAFIILSFIIVHVYMTTTGHTITSNWKSMITGWDEV